MTCRDAREQLSALMDDALAAPERGVLEAHLAACAECRRELEHLRATIALLDRLPPAHAPAGFVDRVMAEAYRRSWPRRILDALFVPLRVKLPLEAVAILLVSVSALYVYQRAPEIRELDQRPIGETASAPAAPTSPSTPFGADATPPESVAKAPPAQEPGAGAGRAPARPRAAREVPRPASPDPSASPPTTATLERRGAPPAPETKTLAKEEVPADRRAEAPAGAASSAAPKQAAKSAESSATQDRAGQRSGVARSKPAAPSAPAPHESEALRGSTGGVTPGSPAAPRPESTSPEAAATDKGPVARRLMRAVDASGRLTVPARAPAEQALDSLLDRLGGARVGRLLEGDRGLIVIDVLVPGARYPELIEGLGRIGRWVTEYEAAPLPTQVRVEIALTLEP